MMTERAEHGPSSMERFTSSLFAQLKQARDDEHASEPGEDR